MLFSSNTAGNIPPIVAAMLDRADPILADAAQGFNVPTVNVLLAFLKTEDEHIGEQQFACDMYGPEAPAGKSIPNSTAGDRERAIRFVTFVLHIADTHDVYHRVYRSHRSLFAAARPEAENNQSTNNRSVWPALALFFASRDTEWTALADRFRNTVRAVGPTMSADEFRNQVQALWAGAERLQRRRDELYRLIQKLEEFANGRGIAPAGALGEGSSWERCDVPGMSATGAQDGKQVSEETESSNCGVPCETVVVSTIGDDSHGHSVLCGCTKHLESILDESRARVLTENETVKAEMEEFAF